MSRKKKHADDYEEMQKLVNYAYREGVYDVLKLISEYVDSEGNININPKLGRMIRDFTLKDIEGSFKRIRWS